jgi:hypothetical protein
MLMVLLLWMLYIILVNPPAISNNKDGTLKKGFWGALRRRLRSNALRSSWVTQHMLNDAVAIAADD